MDIFLCVLILDFQSSTSFPSALLISWINILFKWVILSYSPNITLVSMCLDGKKVFGRASHNIHSKESTESTSFGSIRNLNLESFFNASQTSCFDTHQSSQKLYISNSTSSNSPYFSALQLLHVVKMRRLSVRTHISWITLLTRDWTHFVVILLRVVCKAVKSIDISFIKYNLIIGLYWNIIFCQYLYKIKKWN